MRCVDAFRGIRIAYGNGKMQSSSQTVTQVKSVDEVDAEKDDLGIYTGETDSQTTSTSDSSESQIDSSCPSSDNPDQISSGEILKKEDCSETSTRIKLRSLSPANTKFKKGKLAVGWNFQRSQSQPNGVRGNNGVPYLLPANWYSCEADVVRVTSMRQNL